MQLSSTGLSPSVRQGSLLILVMLLVVGCVQPPPRAAKLGPPARTTDKMLLVTILFEEEAEGSLLVTIPDVVMTYGNARLPETPPGRVRDYWVHLIGPEATVRFGLRDPRRQSLDEGPNRGMLQMVRKKYYVARIPFLVPGKLKLQEIRVLKGAVEVARRDVRPEIRSFCAGLDHVDCNLWESSVSPLRSERPASRAFLVSVWCPWPLLKIRKVSPSEGRVRVCLTLAPPQTIRGFMSLPAAMTPPNVGIPNWGEKTCSQDQLESSS